MPRQGAAPGASPRIGIALLTTLWPLLAAAGQSGGLDGLMALLAQRQHGVAAFEQDQYLSVLTRPAHSSGTLTYDAPDHLEEHTLQPREQSAVLDHGVLTVQIGTRQRRLALRDYPQLAPLLESIRATLAGDRAALEQWFALDLQGDLDHWQLSLRPLDAKLAASVAQVRLRGERAAVLEVEVQQSDGDHSLMRITPRE
jgi:Outer membrane lipoprotein carrier protein LolA-like